jgi:hypothetical protein
MPRRDDYDYEDDDRPRRDEYDDYDRDDDYDDRPKRRGEDEARSRVSLPAIFLMITAGLGLIMFGLNAYVELSGMNKNQQNPFLPPGQKADPAAEQVGKVIGFAVQIIWVAIVGFGGMMMKNLKSRGFVLFSCIWAMLPCNMCCVLGIPFGIWALVVISDAQVKRYFT